MEQKKIFMKRAGARGDSRLARVLTAIVMMFTLATTGAWADGITVNFPIGDGAYISWGGSMTKNGIKIQANSSKTLFYNNSPAQFEAYGENVTYTISMEDGSDIKGVNITLSGNNDMFQNSDGWTASGNTRTWTGNAKSVTFGINCKDNDEDDEWFSLFISAISITLPPPAKYTVTVNDGTETPDWTIAPAEATTTGVEENTTITATYNGTRHVKSVTAVVKPSMKAVPLTVEAITAGTIVVNIGGTLSTGMKYSLDDGQSKTTITTTTNIPVSAGQKVQFYGNGTSTKEYGNSPEVKFQGSGSGFQTKVYGNIMSLLDEEDYETATTISGNWVFYGLFEQNVILTDASGLLLPAETLAQYCYNKMFSGCSSLTAAPDLPATTLAIRCYTQMFSGCSSLTTAPVLPATELAEACYQNMFSGCESLTAAPELPAETLAKACYYDMFSGSGLTTAPVLPAETLAPNCYHSMFMGGSSLTAAPELPATTLDFGCYTQMFKGCSSLTAAPELPATELKEYCYRSMFENCSKLSSVTCKATDISADYCILNWLDGAGTQATSPKLYVQPSMTTASWSNGNFTVTAISE